MGTYIDSKIITLTSQSATIKKNGTYLSNVEYQLGPFVQDDKDIIHRQITLQSAQIPYSFYVINYTNNQFKYRLGSGTIFTSSIPTGNYTGNSLITALKSALTANSITLAIVLSSIDGKLTFTHASSNFTFYPLTYSILPTLGFATNTTYTSASFTLSGIYPLNLLGIKVLQIRSSLLTMGNYSSIQSGMTTLLGTIPVSCTPFGMIDYTDKGQNRITFSNSSLDAIDIEILDGETGEFINFNNQDWTMTLCVYLTRLIEPPEPQTNHFQGLSLSSLQQGTNGSPAPPPLEKTPNKEPNKDMQELQLLSS